MIFGRGGEEIETLAEHGIPFEVVPGVTAASGCGSYAGIPLTHRDHSQICVFATGHLKDGSVNLDWKALARPNQTVVFYMGIGGADEICRQLMANGLPADHPAAVVQHGTSRRQRVVTATLDTLPDPDCRSGYPAAGADHHRHCRHAAIETGLVQTARVIKQDPAPAVRQTLLADAP